MGGASFALKKFCNTFEAIPFEVVDGKNIELKIKKLNEVEK